MNHAPALSLRSVLLSLLLAMAGMSSASAEDLSTSSGSQLFQRFCASCHGKEAEGNGPVAPFFRIMPPDLTRLSRRSRGTFPTERVRSIIDGRTRMLPHGMQQMPVWGLEFETTADEPVAGRAAAEASLARLVEYLRSIQK